MAAPAERTAGAPELDWARTTESMIYTERGGCEEEGRHAAASSPRTAALPRRRMAEALAPAEHTAFMNEAIAAKAHDQRVSARREVKEKMLDMCDARLCHCPHCKCDAACGMRRTSSAQRMRRMVGRYPKGAGNPTSLTFRPH